MMHAWMREKSEAWDASSAREGPPAFMMEAFETLLEGMAAEPTNVLPYPKR